jgi:hypothetical protein
MIKIIEVRDNREITDKQVIRKVRTPLGGVTADQRWEGQFMEGK